jgi:hypothetical protein
MALIVTTPVLLAKSVQTGRPTTTSASAPVALPIRDISPVMSFRSLHPRLVMADSRIHGAFSLRTGLARISSCFATAGTSGTIQAHSMLLEGSSESEEARKVTKKEEPRLLDRDFSGTPYVPVYVMLPVLCILKFHVYTHILIISWLRSRHSWLEICFLGYN